MFLSAWFLFNCFFTLRIGVRRCSMLLQGVSRTLKIETTICNIKSCYVLVCLGICYMMSSDCLYVAAGALMFIYSDIPL